MVSEELKSGIISTVIVTVLEIVNNLPSKGIPDLVGVYEALRLGIGAGLTFYLINRGIKAVNSE